MVPKKHLSKRMPASKRYKITKKAAEKHRKDKKAAKKNPTTSKLKKDPGIPSMYPFKEKLLNQIEESKRKTKEESAARVLLNKQKQQLQASNSSSQSNLQDLSKNASERADQFELAQDSAINQDNSVEFDGAVTGNKDNSRRAYYREFMKVAKASDVILFVLDSRDPLGTRSKQIEDMITEKFNKKLVFVLNKTDLVPKEILLQWLSYLRKEKPTLLFKANTQQQRTNLGHSSFGAVGGTTECVGGESLLQLLKNYTRNLNIKTAITVGVIGFPNVGKSSIINSLKRARVCGVGSTPGFTKSVQLVHLDKTIRLLDSPGVVFNFTLNRNTKNTQEQNEICLRNIVKVELLTNPVGPAEVVINRCNRDVLAQKYNVLPFKDSTEFLVQLSRTRGRFKRGGIPDIQSAARIILNDWNTGKIPYYTTVPNLSKELGNSAAEEGKLEIVSSWGKEFDLEALSQFDKEVVDSLPSSGDSMQVDSKFNLKKRKSTSSDSVIAMSVSTGKELKLNNAELEMDNGPADDEISDLSDIELENDSASVEIDDSHEMELEESAGVVINMKPTGTKATKRQRIEKVTEPELGEALLNPQINRQNKKNLKRQAKKENKKKLLELSNSLANKQENDDENLSDDSTFLSSEHQLSSIGVDNNEESSDEEL